MAQIPNFEAEEFDDPKEFRKRLTAVLKDLDTDANAPQDIDIGQGVIFQAIDNGNFIPPDGYEIVNGRNGTQDPTKVKIIYIQKKR